MKTLIATALVLSAGLAQAHSFDHEKQIGSADLFPTLATDGIMATGTVTDRQFAYQAAVNTPDLFPTLHNTGDAPVMGERTVFEYQFNIGTRELDPSLSS